MEGRIQPSWASGARVPTKDLEDKILLDPRVARVCCGRTIEPYLAEIRDYSGPSLFVSVWRCPHCGRVTS
jgi:hypothetical protein